MQADRPTVRQKDEHGTNNGGKGNMVEVVLKRNCGVANMVSNSPCSRHRGRTTGAATIAWRLGAVRAMGRQRISRPIGTRPREGGRQGGNRGP